MRSRLLINLFLLLLVIALGMFLFVDEADQNNIKNLSVIPANNINQITIHHNQRDIILSKISQQWHLIKPVEISANQFRIKTLLSLLSTTSHAQYNVNNLDLGKYGLDKSGTFIRFNDIQIDFGIVNPINNLRYVKINDELHLIDDNYFPLLSSQIGTLVARELLPAAVKINKLVLPEQTLSLNDADLWQSTDNITTDAITETVYQWTHKQAFAVHDYVVRKSLAEIKVNVKNNDTPIVFHITDVDPWLIIARPDLMLEYHFNSEDYDTLLRPGAAKKLVDDLNNETMTETLQVSPDEFINSIQSQ
ncbi:MAG: DUF4340 domain-containing protein [Gammaproteobacteria bacterium]|nr:DUF4340 domain-containing protein [Gammaproteobacteria bacterium]